MCAEAVRAAQTAAALLRELRQQADPEVAASSQRFFKTAPGQYGAGDRFLGLRVPQLRKAAKAYAGLEQAQLLHALRSPWHEVRLCALLVMVAQFERGDANKQRALYRTYLANIDFVNGWDLVDTSAPAIVGGYLCHRSHRPLYKLIRSMNLWQRRIALLATFTFIRLGDFSTTLALAQQVLDDEEDLIHKAAGWMLREVGLRNRAAVTAFLDRFANQMPRTMLRYSIERFPDRLRRHYLAR
ncbi:MAG: DNA alkylation repair protein [Gammaproteobacteria bacterium]|nr:DNA alkylation repair protein [Gammaproteobacteria bacterium]